MQNYGERVRKPDILMIRVILRREKIPMVDKVIENNRVSIVGEIVSDFRYSHQVYGEGFYIVDVAVSRLSELSDVIPLMVSERLVDVIEE